jgi:hypothetical protein
VILSTNYRGLGLVGGYSLVDFLYLGVLFHHSGFGFVVEPNAIQRYGEMGFPRGTYFPALAPSSDKSLYEGFNDKILPLQGVEKGVLDLCHVESVVHLGL